MKNILKRNKIPRKLNYISLFKKIDKLSAEEFNTFIDDLIYKRRITIQNLPNRAIYHPDDLEVIAGVTIGKQPWASIRIVQEGKRFKYTIYATCEEENGNSVGLIFSDPRLMYNDLVNNVNGIEIQRGTQVEIMSGPGATPITGRLFGIHYFRVRNSVYKQADNTVHVVLATPEDTDVIIELNDSEKTLVLKVVGYLDEDED